MRLTENPFLANSKENPLIPEREIIVSRCDNRTKQINALCDKM